MSWFDFSLLDVWNRPEIKMLRGGVKLAAKGIASANTKEEHEKAKTTEFSELLKKAEAGDSEAQFDLAMYYYDCGERAEFGKWLNEAAKQGNERALDLLESLGDG
jgi:TPR repeat protein